MVMLVLLGNAAYAFHATDGLGKTARPMAISRSNAAEMGFFGQMGFGGECPFPHGGNTPKMQTAEAPAIAPAWRGTAKDWWPNKVNLNLLKGNDPTGGETSSCAPHARLLPPARLLPRYRPPPRLSHAQRPHQRLTCVHWPQIPRSLTLSTSTR